MFSKPVKGTGGERFIEGSEFLVSLDSSRLVALGTYWLRYFLFVFFKKKRKQKENILLLNTVKWPPKASPSMGQLLGDNPQRGNWTPKSTLGLE